MKTSSVRPFGYKGKLFERRRDAEMLVETVQANGGDARWIPWGKKYKVYYSSGAAPKKIQKGGAS